MSRAFWLVATDDQVAAALRFGIQKEVLSKSNGCMPLTSQPEI
jgi:hypothetical protein